MYTEHSIYQISLIVSFVIHGVLFAALFVTQFRDPPKPEKDIELVYYTEVFPAKEKVPPVKKLHSIQEQKLKPQPKILTRKYNIQTTPDLGKTDKGHSRLNVDKKFNAKVSVADQKRFISIPILKSEKISNPRYVNYNERIRQKIRDRAYFYVDDPEFQSGEVYLTFILSSDGQLKQIKIIEERSQANDYLRSVGLRSIQESSPFPPFPPDLQYPELTFNVVISFKLGD